MTERVRGGRRYRWWVASAFVAAPVVALLALVGPSGSYRLLFRDNLIEVIPGEVYRSAQPSGARLEEWMERYRLRSILNLRGHTNDRPWYVAEREVADRYGAHHYTVRISAERLPGGHELRELARVLESAPRPLLLHCEGGVERTGLAAAVAVLLQEDGDLERAHAQFAPEKGLVPGLHSRRSLFDPWLRSDLLIALEQYAEWLDDSGLAHDRRHFRNWIDTTYVPYFYRAELAAPSDRGEVRAGATLPVAVTNTSPEPIPFRTAAVPGVRLGARITTLDSAGAGEGPDPVPGELRGEAVDRDLAPGEVLNLKLALPSLPPGRYRLLVDLVNEGEKWFAQMGSPPLELVLVSGAAASSTASR